MSPSCKAGSTSLSKLCLVSAGRINELTAGHTTGVRTPVLMPIICAKENVRICK
jgi:hypothetical protein